MQGHCRLRSRRKQNTELDEAAEKIPGQVVKDAVWFLPAVYTQVGARENNLKKDHKREKS